jgi:formylglycine-generating enzyme
VRLRVNADSLDAVMERDGRAAPGHGVVLIPGGTFRMGSDKHYPEEAAAHRVMVSDLWIDRTPIANRQFKEFVKSTGHKTFAEIPPDPENYPGALPHMIFAGSLVFSPPRHPVDLRDWSQWWILLKGAPHGAIPAVLEAVSIS